MILFPTIIKLGMKYDHPTAKKYSLPFPKTCIHLVYGNRNLEKKNVSETLNYMPTSLRHTL